MGKTLDPQKTKYQRTQDPADVGEMVFAEIDSTEFEEARRDPVVKEFAAAADARVKRLRKMGILD